MTANRIKLCDGIIKVLKNNGFNMEEITEQNGKYYVEMNQSTPEGEDWWETVWFDGTEIGFIGSIVDRSDSFDVDEEVEVWIECRGKNGVPSSIQDLVKDAEWKKEQIENLAYQLQIM